MGKDTTGTWRGARRDAKVLARPDIALYVAGGDVYREIRLAASLSKAGTAYATGSC